jgi:hypothetical protein
MSFSLQLVGDRTKPQFVRRVLAPHPFGAYAKIRSRRIFDAQAARIVLDPWLNEREKATAS